MMRTYCRVLQILNNATSVSFYTISFSFLLAGDMKKCLNADLANSSKSCHAFCFLLYFIFQFVKTNLRALKLS